MLNLFDFTDCVFYIFIADAEMTGHGNGCKQIGDITFTDKPSVQLERPSVAVTDCKISSRCAVTDIFSYDLCAICLIYSITATFDIAYRPAFDKFKVIVNNGKSVRRQRIDKFEFRTLNIFNSLE